MIDFVLSAQEAAVANIKIKNEMKEKRNEHNVEMAKMMRDGERERKRERTREGGVNETKRKKKETEMILAPTKNIPLTVRFLR